MNVLIANGFSDSLRKTEHWPHWWVQRIAWFARAGDILILPGEPDPDFFQYVASMTDTPFGEISVLILPDHQNGPASLSERLLDAGFMADFFGALRGREITSLFALWPDAELTDFARATGMNMTAQGWPFLSQDGGRLANSKSVFRALAAGAGVSIPRGGVCQDPTAAFRLICDLFREGEDVIIKQDYMTGGKGNVILTRGGDFNAVGAREVVVMDADDHLRQWLTGHWSTLTGGPGERIVIERYFRGSRAVFAEYRIDDEACRLWGTGELLSSPFACGQVMPPAGFSEKALRCIEHEGEQLARSLQLLGYRGYVSADAIVTPEGDVFFTEYNGRVTGSTHIYAVIGQQVIGNSFGKERLLLERIWPEGWSTPSFRDALLTLTQAGLAYDSDTRKGVILTSAWNPDSSGVMYCIAAADLQEARESEITMASLFSASRVLSLPPLPY